MSRTTARIVTPNGSKYLQQLCKHWSHRFVETSFDAEAGRVPFDDERTLELRAHPDGLDLALDAPADQQLRMQGVVIEHLRRFAFRETLPDPDWSPAA